MVAYYGDLEAEYSYLVTIYVKMLISAIVLRMTTMIEHANIILVSKNRRHYDRQLQITLLNTTVKRRQKERRSTMW